MYTICIETQFMVFNCFFLIMFLGFFCFVQNVIIKTKDARARLLLKSWFENLLAVGKFLHHSELHFSHWLTQCMQNTWNTPWYIVSTIKAFVFCNFCYAFCYMWRGILEIGKPNKTPVIVFKRESCLLVRAALWSGADFLTS